VKPCPISVFQHHVEVPYYQKISELVLIVLSKYNDEKPM
jgi:hypothetical protein